MAEDDVKKVHDVAQITVSSRIPEFWEDAPRVWFVQLESVIHSQKLGDAAKYHLVVTKLGKRVIQEITATLTNPPQENKYETLKAKLLHIYEESQCRQVQKLIGEMNLGDQKPSQLLRRMMDLAGNNVNNETLRVLWQKHLPSSVRAVLAVADSAELETLASIADKVMENMKPISVDAVESSEHVFSSGALMAEIAKINVRLANMERSRSRPRQRHQDKRKWFSRSRGRRRSVSMSRRTPDSKDWLCSYHYYYKDKAHKCVQPCAWKQSGN